jgi:hypothetical protein
MASAKDLIVKPISAADANRIVKSLHYSGKVVQNSQLHLGVFLNGRCGGAMQFGPSLDKRKIQPLVSGTLWNEFLELNRMAFADWLPRNSESRCIAYAMRWIRKTYPHIKWIVSFADGTQCGDGTIYRASGFVLTGIKENDQIWQAPSGEVFNDTSIRPGIGGERERERERERESVSSSRERRSPTAAASVSKQGQSRYSVVSRTTMTKANNILDTGASSMKAFKDAGWKPLPGFQLRYIYFIDPTARERLTVPIIPFSEIARRGAGMYRGKPRAGSAGSGTPPIQGGRGGATPTPALSSQEASDGKTRPA